MKVDCDNHFYAFTKFPHDFVIMIWGLPEECFGMALRSAVWTGRVGA